MEQVFPFHIIPAGGAGVARIPGPSGEVTGKLQLHIITGGPVFLFKGRKETSEVTAILTGDTVDFDVASTLNCCGEIEVTPPGIEMITMYSTQDSIGYVRYVQKDTNHLRMIEESIARIERDGLRIPHDTHSQTPPIHPGAPELVPMRGHMRG